MKALLGKKIGMTQVYQEDGRAIPVTIVDVKGNVVSNILKNKEGELTHIEIGIDKKKNPRKSEEAEYKKIKFVPKFKKTLKIKNEEDKNLEIGTELKAEAFEEGEKVDVVGISKGKGFQGVVKRWGFAGGPKTHGQSDRHRAPGSIGAGTTPGRVLKGKKMAGRMGGENMTVKNLKVVKVVNEDGLLGVSGSIPGSNGDYVLIKKTRN